MEANNDNDKLDRFVRDAFDGYEELPSGGMWDRIEAGLPPQRWSWTRYRWSIAAAGAILLLASSLICQHLYYKEKIQTLSKTHSVDSGKANPNVAPLPEIAQDIDSQNNTYKTTSPTADLTTGLEREATTQKTASGKMVGKDSPDLTVGGNLPPVLKKQRAPSDVKIFGERGKGVVQGLERGGVAVVPQSQAGLRPGNTSTPSSTSLSPKNPASPEATHNLDNTAVPAATPNKIFASLNALPSGRFAALQTVAPVATLPLPSPIKPARTLSDWYVGLQVAPSLSTEKIPAPNRALPPWGGGPRRPEVVNERETTAYTTDFWLKAGKKINRHLSLESGIGFRNITRSAEHKPAFEFRDGHPQGGPHGGGGGHPKCFDFDYQLDAYGGTASVSLRMTQVDSGINISDKEPIGLKIKTEQRAQILKIPLLAAVSISKGRYVGVLKAGLVGSFLLKNELSIEGLTSLNNKFQPEVPAKPRQEFAAPKKFIPGYWASAAVEYRLNRHWSAFVEPTITGDFSAEANHGRSLPRDFSAALNLGVNYYF